MTEMKKLNLAIFEAYKYLRPPLGNFKERWAPGYIHSFQAELGIQGRI